MLLKLVLIDGQSLTMKQVARWKEGRRSFLNLSKWVMKVVEGKIISLEWYAFLYTEKPSLSIQWR